MVQGGKGGDADKPDEGGVAFLPPRTLVLVKWRDAMGGTRGGWRPMGTMHAPLADCESVGWVAEHDTEKIVVVPHVAGDDGDGEIAIPTPWVQKITLLTPKRGKRNVS